VQAGSADRGCADGSDAPDPIERSTVSVGAYPPGRRPFTCATSRGRRARPMSHCAGPWPCSTSAASPGVWCGSGTRLTGAFHWRT